MEAGQAGQVSQPVASSSKLIEMAGKPANPTATYLFMGLDQQVLVPGKPVDGVLVLVANRPITVSKIGITWYGIEYVSWWQGLTQSDHCESNKWWIAKRTGIFPEDGSACMYTDPRTVSTPTINSLNPNHGGRKDFAPGTYTFPFSYTLPAPLPGSFEDNDASLVFSNSLLPRTLDDKKRSYIRYTASSYVEILTKAADKATNLGQAKDFNVVELFSSADLVCDPLTITNKQEYLIGGHINCGITVANGGVLMSGYPLHVRVDVDNQSRYPVDQISLTLNQIITFRAKFKEQLQEFRRPKQVLLVGVKDVDVKESQRLTKAVRLVPKPGQKWSPSVTLGEHISVAYELVANFFIIAENIEIRVPIRVCQFSSLLQGELPIKVPHEFGPEIDFTPDWLAKLRAEADSASVDVGARAEDNARDDGYGNIEGEDERRDASVYTYDEAENVGESEAQ